MLLAWSSVAWATYGTVQSMDQRSGHEENPPHILSFDKQPKKHTTIFCIFLTNRCIEHKQIDEIVRILSFPEFWNFVACNGCSAIGRATTKNTTDSFDAGHHKSRRMGGHQ
eukprot:2903820-Amphidinium_carterae.1